MKQTGKYFSAERLLKYYCIYFNSFNKIFKKYCCNGINQFKLHADREKPNRI